MVTDNLTVRTLAQLLLHFKGEEAVIREGEISSTRALEAAVDTFETLRWSLSRTIGSVGFQALLARSLVLAKEQVSWLNVVSVNEEGSLSGLVERGATETAESVDTGCVTLLTELLKLLITFVGIDLTILLVRDVWPNVLTHSSLQVLDVLNVPSVMFSENKLFPNKQILVNPHDEKMGAEENSE